MTSRSACDTLNLSCGKVSQSAGCSWQGMRGSQTTTSCHKSNPNKNCVKKNLVQYQLSMEISCGYKVATDRRITYESVPVCHFLHFFTSPPLPLSIPTLFQRKGRGHSIWFSIVPGSLGSFTYCQRYLSCTTSTYFHKSF